ncbi:MAG: hypothetical protein Q8S33_23810 [Myxococcales bacterium]|nr:hypothetical protein [Myxococcales bacterium]
MRRLGLLSALLLLSSCRDPASLFGTAVVVTTDSSETPSEQLRYEAHVDGGALLEPAVRPATAAGILAPSTSVRILLGDAVAGQLVDITVTGLVDGGEVGRGRAAVLVQQGVERPVTVRLAAGVSACRGCLSSAGACVDPPTAGACGVSGSDCVVCDAQMADTCSATGQCACGSEPTCSAALGADRCEGGRCQCGAGPSCEAGQECLSQTCQCTPSSCPSGCCQGNQCITTPSSSSCGSNGRACLDCGGSACTGGQCAMSTCNAISCASGCCIGSSCVTVPTNGACGSEGRACEQCGQGTCDGGACVGTCNAQTCPAGCCVAGVCQPGTLPSACGTGGVACATCTTTCTNKQCVNPCGAGNCAGCCQAGTCRAGTTNNSCGSDGGVCVSCGAGASCMAGRCVTTAACNVGNCPNGCCDGDVCRTSSITSCGRSGVACVSCSPLRADTCNTSGVCRCGANAQCGSGQRCEAGTCVCDPTSCPGCCNGNTCSAGTSRQQCGVDGGVCVFCPGGQQCVTGRCQ